MPYRTTLVMRQCMCTCTTAQHQLCGSACAHALPHNASYAAVHVHVHYRTNASYAAVHVHMHYRTTLVMRQCMCTCTTAQTLVMRQCMCTCTAAQTLAHAGRGGPDLRRARPGPPRPADSTSVIAVGKKAGIARRGRAEGRSRRPGGTRSRVAARRRTLRFPVCAYSSPLYAYSPL